MISVCPGRGMGQIFQSISVSQRFFFMSSLFSLDSEENLCSKNWISTTQRLSDCCTETEITSDTKLQPLLPSSRRGFLSRQSFTLNWALSDTQSRNRNRQFVFFPFCIMQKSLAKGFVVNLIHSALLPAFMVFTAARCTGCIMFSVISLLWLSKHKQEIGAVSGPRMLVWLGNFCSVCLRFQSVSGKSAEGWEVAGHHPAVWILVARGANDSWKVCRSLHLFSIFSFVVGLFPAFLYCCCSFYGLRCWYGWAFSNCSVQVLKEKQKRFIFVGYCRICGILGHTTQRTSTPLVQFLVFNFICIDFFLWHNNSLTLETQATSTSTRFRTGVVFSGNPHQFWCPCRSCRQKSSASARAVSSGTWWSLASTGLDWWSCWSAARILQSTRKNCLKDGQWHKHVKPQVVAHQKSVQEFPDWFSRLKTNLFIGEKRCYELVHWRKLFRLAETPPICFKWW